MRPYLRCKIAEVPCRRQITHLHLPHLHRCARAGLEPREIGLETAPMMRPTNGAAPTAGNSIERFILRRHAYAI
jgi:hypothetical protein